MGTGEEARVDEEQILRYVLSSEHPVGADKARFFNSAGYGRDEWRRLRADLLSIKRRSQAGSEQGTRFGIKDVGDAMVQTPDGRTIEFRTVWISDRPDEPPRLVTAYPS